MKELNLENAPAYAASRRDSEESKKVIYRVRPRFESGYVLGTRTSTRDMSDPADVADALRETAADAETLRDTLNDWIEGQYGIAENDNGELESLREIVGNMSIVTSNAAHMLEKSAAAAQPAPYEPNAAECLEMIERVCADSIPDTELCDMVSCAVRDARKALGLPNDSGAGMVADKLETLKEQGQSAEPANALHWRVDATDEKGNTFTMGEFYTKSDATEYAARLDACEIGSWDARVKEIV